MPVGIVAAGTAAAGGGAAGGGAAAGATAASSAGAGTASAGAASSSTATASASAASGAGAVAGTAAKGGQAAASGSKAAAKQSFERARNMANKVEKGESYISKAAQKQTEKDRKEQDTGETISKSLGKDTKKTATMAVAGVFAMKILAPVLIPVLIFSFLTSTIYYVTPLSLFDWSYDETMDLPASDEERKTFLQEIANLIKNDSEETTNGKILAEDLVKLYKASNFKIDMIGPDEIEYLHPYSNFIDVMIIYSTLQATDPELTEEPTYVFNVDVDETQSDKGLWSKFVNSFKRFIGYINIFRQNIEAKKDATKLLKEIYKEMFYYKVHVRITPLGRIYIKVNIYNKDIQDYIDEHDLTEDQIAMIEDAMNEENWNSECDNDYSEYHQIAYRQGNGSYYYTNKDGTVLAVNSGGITSTGYGSKNVPQTRQAFVNEVAAAAIAEYQREGNTHKILPSVVVAQACYESGWGESYSARYRKNIFGIMYKGEKRTFSSWTECLRYYFTDSLIYKAIYKGAWNNNDPYDSLKKIIAGGYCQGDPNYEINCMSIINTYGFTYFDEVAKGNISIGTQLGEAAIYFAETHTTKSNGARYSQAERAKDGETVFDCSSYVWYAYKYAGLTIGGEKTTYPLDSRGEYSWLNSQGCLIYDRNAGDSLSSVLLQPGDLLFYSTDHSSNYTAKIYHVDIYKGNGNRLSAEGTKWGVGEFKVKPDRIDVIMRPSMANCFRTDSDKKKNEQKKTSLLELDVPSRKYYVA